MRKFTFHLIVLTSLICLLPQTGFAQTGYVSDMLLLTFRQGPGNTYPITKTLKSNTPVNILEENNGFYKVELKSNETGWVDKKFITFEKPKSMIINKLMRENAALKNSLSKFESSASILKEAISSKSSEHSMQITDLDASLKKALDEKTAMDNALSESQTRYNELVEQSKDIQNIIKENKQLKASNTALSKDYKNLKKNSGDVLKTGMIKWFLAGVGVLLLGWLIGQSVSSKKRGGSSYLS